MSGGNAVALPHGVLNSELPSGSVSSSLPSDGISDFLNSLGSPLFKCRDKFLAAGIDDTFYLQALANMDAVVRRNFLLKEVGLSPVQELIVSQALLRH